MSSLLLSSVFSYVFGVTVAILELFRQSFEILNQIAGDFNSNPFFVMILMSFISDVSPRLFNFIY